MVATTIYNTFGAAFVGVTASTFIFGIFSMQCYMYYQRYPADRSFFKRLVAVIWLLEALHSFCSLHFFFHYEIGDWGREVKITSEPIVWSLAVQVILSAIIGTVVKGCFAWRVWNFSNMNIWITAAIVLSTLAQLCFSIWFMAAGLKLPSLEHLGDIFTVAIAALGLGVLTDVLTAAVMTWYLLKLKTGYKKDDTLVNKLVRYAVNTGLLTSAFSIACLITYGTMPDNFIFISLYFVLSKLYANSLLAALNTRQPVEGRGTDKPDETIPTFVMCPPQPSSDDASGVAWKWERSSSQSSNIRLSQIAHK